MTLLSNLADRLCSHQPQLRPFDRGDWQAFSGAESDSPEICYTDAATVLLDGHAVEVHLYATDEDRELGYREDGDIFADTFADEAEARVVAEFLIANPGLAPKIMGESVGSF